MINDAAWQRTYDEASQVSDTLCKQALRSTAVNFQVKLNRPRADSWGRMKVRRCHRKTLIVRQGATEF